MNKAAIASLIALALIAGFLILYRSERAPAGDTRSAQPRSEWETKTDEQAGVTVSVTPLDLFPQSAEWQFNVIMDTHSVELDQDLTKAAVLISDQGREYAPTRWEGPVGGHHREGELIFSRIVPMPRYIELKISGIAGVARTFSWQLTNTP